jgi:serine/threonine protein phosphatase 1
VSKSVITEASGDRVFAIGDVHGCAMELEALLSHLAKHEGLTSSDLVVFLGDYIDRGPDSKMVIDVLLEFHKTHANTRFLKGNHEDMMLDFLGFGGKLGHAFLYNGGLETVQSYGLSVFAPANEMIEAIPDSHLEFIKGLESILVVDNFIFVHAGLNRLLELTDQVDSEIFWIREDFINDTHDFGKTIVFGHTPHREIMLHLPYKIGLDTGLVFGHKLSCLEVKSGHVLEVDRGSVKVKTTQCELQGVPA